MKNPDMREMMAGLYRLVEKYEETPEIKYVDDGLHYFEGVVTDSHELYDRYPGNEFAQELIVGFVLAVEKRFKVANPEPLAERT